MTVRDHASVADAVARTYRAGGPSAFFRGFWPSTVTVFLYTGIELTAYERLKQRLGPAAAAPGPRESQWPVNLASALCSSAAGVVACYPISTIITRLQADDGTVQPARNGSAAALEFTKNVPFPFPPTPVPRPNKTPTDSRFRQNKIKSPYSYGTRSDNASKTQQKVPFTRRFESETFFFNPKIG